MLDDLLDARDDLESLLDEALPALDARPTAEGAEMLAVLLVAPLRRGGPSERLRRLVVRRVEHRGTPAAAAVLDGLAALADPDTAARAAAAVDRLHSRGVESAIAGVGEARVAQGWRFAAPAPVEQLAARMERPGEPRPYLLKLWFDPGEGQRGGALAGGWTEPLAERRLRPELMAFGRRGEAAGEPEPLDAVTFAAQTDRIVRAAAERGVPVTEALALVLPQLRRAVGSPDWPPFHVLPEPEAPRRSPRNR